MLNRRKFLTIAAAAATPIPGFASSTPLHTERGVALGAQVTLRFAHPDAPAIARAAMAEINRLEDIFSLYRPHSTLSRLNADGVLATPPPELMECLSIVSSVHHASAGRFDPTVQVLWQGIAGALEQGVVPESSDLAELRELVGWSRVHLSPQEIQLGDGQSLTLNGIAQGYIADRIVTFLEAQGLPNVLIDTGELRASGIRPDTNSPWRVELPAGSSFELAGAALATSAPDGMLLAGDPSRSHIFDPATGGHVQRRWKSVTVVAQNAALADAASTACCLCSDESEMVALCNQLSDTRLINALAI